jgi:8-oxo-dGTP diphosphatase
MWDFLGGHVEMDETPAECIVREMKEEIGIELENFKLFKIYEFDDRIEHVFLKKADLDINEIVLTEGQKLKYFSSDEILNTELAYGFNLVIKDVIDAEL